MNQRPPTIITSGLDRTLKFWDTKTQACIRSIQYADSQVNVLQLSPDNKLLAVGGNPSLHLYDLNSQDSVAVAVFEGHRGNITAIGFQDSMEWLFTASEDGSIRIWDMRTHSAISEMRSRSMVNGAVLLPNNTEIISVDREGALKIWDLQNSLCLTKVEPEVRTPLQTVSVLPRSNETLVVAGNNKGRCFVWDMQNESEKTSLHPRAKFQAHEGYITKVRISPDGERLATSSSDKTIKLWDMNNFEHMSTLTGHQKWVWDCVFSPDSTHIFSVSSDQTARMWSTETAQPLRQFAGHTKAVTSLVYL